MRVEGFVFGVVGFLLFMLGGRIRTVFLYLMFTLCVEVLAFGNSQNHLTHITTWVAATTIYAYAVAQNAQTGGPIGLIGKWWWMFRYACHMRRRTIDCSWGLCWSMAQCAIENDDYWNDWSPKDACNEELSCWSD